MRILYLDCSMGAAGDMLMGALLELTTDRASFMEEMNGLGLPGVQLTAEPAEKCGIYGTHITVLVHHKTEEAIDSSPAHSAHHSSPPSACTSEHQTHDVDSGHSASHSHHAISADSLPSSPSPSHHPATSLADLEALIGSLPIPQPVRNDALAVYRLIAEAESRVHRTPVGQIHFHEVGMLDAVADIVGVCRLIHLLAPDQILASPIRLGGGQVQSAHGWLPVPAPATAEILKGVPVYGGAIAGELCTPTGAALLKHFVRRFDALPIMRVEQIGYGMGTKNYPAPNCVRALFGESMAADDGAASGKATGKGEDTVLELVCNLDDMTGEAIGFAVDHLIDAEALDVWTQAVGMKKHRPGVVLGCLCRPEQRDQMIRLIFRHTSTLGIRIYPCCRATLDRRQTTFDSPHGLVRIKTASGWGVTRAKIEYEDLARIARQEDVSLDEAAAWARCFAPSGQSD